MFKEFQKFISRGNVVDLAVAVIVGAAFSTIVNSFITDIVTPMLLQPVMNSLDITELEKVAWHGIKYGKFIAAIINFFVTAFIVFLMVRGMNKVKELKEKLEKEEDQKKEETKTVLTTDQKLLEEIRDLLKAQQSSKNQ